MLAIPLLLVLFDSCVWRLLALAAMLTMTGGGWVLRLLLGWAFRIVL